MITEITGAAFKDMVINASNAINIEKQAINDLNVFPVPDGDTGTNMSLTIGTASTELKKHGEMNISEASDTVASALLRGARGNSGVILSLLFRGISKEFKGCEKADAKTFAAAMQNGVSSAYKAVMKPAEGTILTVSRLASDAAVAAAKETDDIENLLEITIRAGKKALENTINQNPVLKKAGVIDAGGKGYICILEGMLKALRGEMIEYTGDASESEGKADFAGLSDEEITFTFDTVFIVRKTVKKSLDPLAAYLDSIGDSLVIGEDDDAFKVHVHTNIPGDALNEAQKYGTLELAKIENMRTQRDDLAAGRKAQSIDDLENIEIEEADAKPEKKFGVVAVCVGDGLSETFTELGVDRIIMGGQTMNPSTEDILKQVKKTPAEIVYVFPNNKNIIMAAEQCIPLVENKKVIVIPTTTVMQGIAAMMNFDASATEEELTEVLSTSFSNVHSASITYAARDSEFDGKLIKTGEFLALLEGSVIANTSDYDVVTRALVDSLKEYEPEIITIFYGKDVPEDDAESLAEVFSEAFPDADVVTAYGGQPVYYYMISAE